VERRHIIKLIPAGVPAGIVPHAVAAPAMIDDKLIDVIAPVTDALFPEYLLDEVDHVSRVVRPVVAAVDEKDIELNTVKSEFLFFPDFLKF
jgi:predicted helicase